MKLFCNEKENHCLPNQLYIEFFVILEYKHVAQSDTFYDIILQDFIHINFEFDRRDITMFIHFFLQRLSYKNNSNNTMNESIKKLTFLPKRVLC